MTKRQIRNAKRRLIGKKTANGSIVAKVTFASELKHNGK